MNQIMVFLGGIELGAIIAFAWTITSNIKRESVLVEKLNAERENSDRLRLLLKLNGIGEADRAQDKNK